MSIAQMQQDLLAQAKTINEIVNYNIRRQDQDKARAELEELKEEHLNERFARIEARVGAVYSVAWWALAGVGSTLLLAVATFVIRGGLIA